MSEAFDRLVSVMYTLRGKEGCPWDKKQTPESLKPFLVEETYEVLEAIDEKDPTKLREELGDLLYQILFQARIAEEAGAFTLDQVLADCSEKMIRRHPHVYGDQKVKDAAEVLARWEDIKKEEKKGRKSILEGVPTQLPALLRAHQLQTRASRVGFDWEHLDQVFAKVDEEMLEFREAFQSKRTGEMESELGDLFFALVNIARFIEINPEEALRKSISRFISRFRYIEEEISRQGREMKEVSLDELNRLWEEAKSQERSHPHP